MKRGFSLLECMIYLSLIIVASLLMSTMCIRFFESTRGHIPRAANTYMSLWVLACHMVRDIRAAPTDISLWVTRDVTMIAWRGASYHAWKFDGTRIFRMEGKEIATVIDGIEQCLFCVEQDGNQIKAVSYRVRRQECEVNGRVLLYEGLFACIS